MGKVSVRYIVADVARRSFR